MKKKMVRIFAVSVIALGTLFVSCDKDTKKEDAAGKSAVTWTTSFEKAKKQPAQPAAEAELPAEE